MGQRYLSIPLYAARQARATRMLCGCFCAGVRTAMVAGLSGNMARRAPGTRLRHHQPCWPTVRSSSKELAYDILYKPRLKRLMNDLSPLQ